MKGCAGERVGLRVIVGHKTFEGEIVAGVIWRVDCWWKIFCISSE